VLKVNIKLQEEAFEHQISQVDNRTRKNS